MCDKWANWWGHYICSWSASGREQPINQSAYEIKSIACVIFSGSVEAFINSIPVCIPLFVFCCDSPRWLKALRSAETRCWFVLDTNELNTTRLRVSIHSSSSLTLDWSKLSMHVHKFVTHPNSSSFYIFTKWSRGLYRTVSVQDRVFVFDLFSSVRLKWDQEDDMGIQLWHVRTSLQRITRTRWIRVWRRVINQTYIHTFIVFSSNFSWRSKNCTGGYFFFM